MRIRGGQWPRGKQNGRVVAITISEVGRIRRYGIESNRECCVEPKSASWVQQAKKPGSVPQAPSPTMTSFLLISLIALVVTESVEDGANAMDQRPNVETTENSSTTLERNTVRQTPHHYQNFSTLLVDILTIKEIVM